MNPVFELPAAPVPVTPYRAIERKSWKVIFRKSAFQFLRSAFTRPDLDLEQFQYIESKHIAMRAKHRRPY